MLFTISEAGGSDSTDSLSSGDHVRLSFKVTNKCNPARPALTPEYIDLVRSGKSFPSASQGTNAMSDQIGLQHSFLAAHAHGMQLSLTQEDGIVTFEGLLQVELAEMPQDLQDETRALDLTLFPSNLQVPVRARRQGLCSHHAHLWATSDSAPRSEAVGTPQAAGVM